MTRGIAELSVDGIRYGGWMSVRVIRSIEQMAGSFELDITERWPGQVQKTPLLPGRKCQLTLDGKAVITGWIDVVSPEIDAEKHSIHVTGRDATGDLVDSAAIHQSGQWHTVKIDQIARDLLKPFGIDLVIETDVGNPFPSYNIQEGETVFECLERAARMRALLITSDPAGRLVITRAGEHSTHAALIEGKNILAARADFSWQDRFSEIILKGQGRLRTDGHTQYAQASATVKDDLVKRYRPLIIIADAHGENASYTDRAEWEKNVRRGRSARGSITVQGWTREDGALWLPNTTVSVTSPSIYLDQAPMLIVGCTYSLDEQSGTLTELSIGRPEAFDSLEGVEASKLFGKLKTKEQREKRERVMDWSGL